MLCRIKMQLTLTYKNLLMPKKYFLRKGPAFIPNPTDINWFNLKCDFASFINKLRYIATKPNDETQKKCETTVRFK